MMHHTAIPPVQPPHSAARAFLVQAEHPEVRGVRQAVCFDQASADALATVWLNDLVSDYRPGGARALRRERAPELEADASQWRGTLRALAFAVLADAGDRFTALRIDIDELLDQHDPGVPVVRVDAVPIAGGQPRVLIALEGGIVSAVLADIAAAVTIIDYDVENSDPSNDVTWAIPQSNGRTAEAFRTTTTASIDPNWITNAQAAQPHRVADCASREIGGAA